MKSKSSLVSPNISFIVKNDICLSCGICEDVCPVGAITVSEKSGRYIPRVDTGKCINQKGCSRCYDICPGQGVDIKRIEQKLFSDSNMEIDPYVGSYLSCFTGHSTNHDIRYHSASGGLVTQMLLYLLEKGIIDGAVVTTFDNKKPFLSKTIIATSKEEIVNARSSKYCPVSMSGIVKELKRRDGKYIVVGVPCHIHGFRKLEEKDSKFRERVFGYFALYCSATYTFNATEFLFNNRKISKDKLEYFSYRDLGCLGSMVVEEKTDDGNKRFAEPYLSYKKPLRSFFHMHRCHLCIDHYGELGDVSLGDIHYGKYKDDTVGTNSLVIRNEKFLHLFINAQKDGFIELHDLDVNVLKKSQTAVYQKKERSSTFMELDKLRGKANPQYDVTLHDSNRIKSVVSYIHTNLQLFIGKHKSLWSLIKLLDGKKA